MEPCGSGIRARYSGESMKMAKHSMAIGVAALVAAAVGLSAPSQAEHENRYFGFSTGYQPYTYTYPYTYYPPPRAYYPPRRGYAPPPRVRQSRPGVYEYEVAPGHWVRVRPGYEYQPPRQRERRVRAPRQQELQRSPGPPPVPKQKPELAARSDTSAPPELTARPPSAQPRSAQPEGVVRAAPERTSRAQQAPATSAAQRISCEAAADIVRDFGFSDVQSTSCSGQVYGFDADRDGSAYSSTISAADGELTEVRRR
jgi:hypothetical protein